MEVGWWALIVSVGSFGVSALTFWRNRTPTPKWELFWDSGREDEGDLITDSIRCVARNRGKGIAQDVLLHAISVDGGKGWASKHADAVPFNDEIELWFSFEHGKDADSGGFQRGEVQLIDPEIGSARFPAREATSTITVELQWSQEPRLHRRRSKVATYKHS